MPEEYGMKVWLELAVKNVKDIKKQVQEQLKGIDLKGIAGKASAAGGQATKAAGLADSAGAKGLGKLALTAGAMLGVLFVIKKIGDKMLAQLVKSSPYLQGILSVMGRAWMLFWRPFGDFLGNLLRPLAISLLRLSVKWLGYTRTPEGKKAVETGMGMGIGGLSGGAIGTIVGGIAAGPVGAFIGWLVGSLTGIVLSLLPEAWQGVKNLFTIITAWLDYFVLEIFGIDMDKVRASVATFMLITIPDFFTKTLPEFFDSAISKLGDLGSWLWGEITGATSNIKTKLGEFSSWLWEEITGGLSNVGGTLSGWASWVWKKITGPLNNLWLFLSGWASWVWIELTDPLSNMWVTLVGYANWVWEELKDPLKNIYWSLVGFGGWLWNKITRGFDNIWGWMSQIGTFLYERITESIIRAFKGFTFGWSWWWSKEASYQTGTSHVPKTGMYELHKGEKVVTASRAADNGRPSIVLSPTFNIYGSNNNESDITSQVRRAARMLEFEVRRGYLL